MRFTTYRSCFFASLVLAALGCGSGDSDTSASTGGGATTGGATGGSGGNGGSGGFMTAPHTQLPLMHDNGGSILEHVNLVSVTFPGYEFQTQVQAFGDWAVSSDWYTTAGAEYGVKAGTHLAKVALTDTAPTSESALLDLVVQRIDDGTLPAPEAPNSDVFYMLYLPKSDKDFDDGEGDQWCAEIDGYHYAVTRGGHKLVYAVIGDCQGSPESETIGTASHELIETATDADAEHGFYIMTKNSDPWEWVSDDEVADMCEYFDWVKVDGFPVTRVWSNAAVLAGTNPCLPVPADETVYRDVSADPAVLQKVKAGQSTTFTLTGWATDPEKPWKIFAEPELDYSDFKAPAKLDAKVISNGGTATLTVTVPTGTKKGDLGIVGIYSDDSYAQAWYVGVIAQ